MSQGNTSFEINLQEENKKKRKKYTLQIIKNVLRFFFFNSPRHSGSNVGNKYVILYTKSRQAGGGRERIVREKQ